MDLAFRHDDSGLFVAEQTRDEEAVVRALKEIDSRLALQKERSSCPGGWEYRVLRIWSEDQPPTPILTWKQPLTNGLIDKVHIHMLGFRGNAHYVSADEHNAKLQAARNKQQADDLAAIRAEHLPRLKGTLSVSMSGKVKNRRGRSASPEMPNAHERI